MSIFFRFKDFVVELFQKLLTTEAELPGIAYEISEDLLPGVRVVKGFFGAVIRAIYVAIFLFFSITGFYGFYATSKFISLDATAGTCNSVPLSWTSVIGADTFG